MIYATLTAQNSAMINLKPEQNILRIGTDSKYSAEDKQVLPQDNLVGLLSAATAQHVVIWASW